MYRIVDQALDTTTGFHVIRLKDGAKEHILQIAVGADACPACGAVYPKDNLGGIDPKAAAADASAALDRSQSQMLAYAAKHGVPVK